MYYNRQYFSTFQITKKTTKGLPSERAGMIMATSHTHDIISPFFNNRVHIFWQYSGELHPLS